jgi:WD40 repeat protein
MMKPSLSVQRFPLIASVASDRRMHIWNLSPRGGTNTIASYRGHDELFACVWKPCGTHLAIGGREGVVEIIDAEAASSQRSYTGHTGAVCTLAWSPDGTCVASGGRDTTIQIWNPDTGVLLSTCHGHRSLVTTLSFSSDGRCLASGSWDGTVQVWRVTDGKLLTMLQIEPKNQVFSVSWSPDGTVLAVASTDVYLYHWDHAKARAEIMRVYDEHSGVVYRIVWSPDGSCLASGSFDGTVHVWDANRGTRVATHQHTAWVRAVAWEPSGNHIASGGRDMQIHLWRADSGHLLCTYHEHQGVVYDVAWIGSPLVSASSDSQMVHVPSSPGTQAPSKFVQEAQVIGNNGSNLSADPPSYTPPRYIPPSAIVSLPSAPVSLPPFQPLPFPSRDQRQSARKRPADKRASPPTRANPPARPPSVPWQRPLPPRKLGVQLAPVASPSSISPPETPALGPSQGQILHPPPSNIPLLPSPMLLPYTVPPHLVPGRRSSWTMIPLILLFVFLSPVFLIMFAYVLAFLGLFLRVLFHL